MASRFVEALGAVSRACAEAATDWYLFGAQAALIHGARRLTADVDVTVRLPGHDAEQLVAALRRNGCSPRVDDPEFLARTRVLPMVHDPTGVPVDLVIAGPGLEDLFLARAELRAVGDFQIPVARAEDVVAMKVLAGRPKDLDDVRDVLLAQGVRLDVELIRETLRLIEAALDQSDLTPTFEALLQRSRG